MIFIRVLGNISLFVPQPRERVDDGPFHRVTLSVLGLYELLRLFLLLVEDRMNQADWRRLRPEFVRPRGSLKTLFFPVMIEKADRMSMIFALSPFSRISCPSRSLCNPLIIVHPITPTMKCDITFRDILVVLFFLSCILLFRLDCWRPRSPARAFVSFDRLPV